jgi:alpha-1,3-rhamnosyl/mannosyltransferase
MFYKKMFEGVRNADQIITASEFSKNDITKFGEVDPKKIKVIYLGVDQKFNKENYKSEDNKNDQILETYNVKTKKYFFYDSGLEANKSIPALLEVFKEILNINSPKVPNYLVMIGKDFYKGEGLNIKPRSIEGENILRYAKKIGVAQNLITTDKISDEHLVHLLFNSKTYINLSSYEGFGLGVAQAMSAGIPAIASDSSCIPEVSQGGAYLIRIDSKSDKKEIAKNIVKYLEDDKQVSEKVRIGQKVAHQYSWDKAALETYDSIKEISTKR